MLTVLATGQSNMVGVRSGGPSPEIADSRITVWNNTTNLGGHGSAFISPPDFGNAPWYSTDGNNMAIWFCDRLAKETGEDVRLILVAKGGEPIAEWDKATGIVYDEINSIYPLTGADPADILLWHQGETDGASGSSTSAAAYKSAFLTMQDNLVADGYLSDSAHLILGGVIRNDAATIDGALQDLASENADIVYASGEGLDSDDGTHFMGASLHHMGYQRMWQSYCTLTGFPRKQASSSLLSF